MKSKILLRISMRSNISPSIMMDSEVREIKA